MPHNIERRPTIRGMYLGYGMGAVWRIVKNGKEWCAYEGLTRSYKYAKTLREISAKIEG